MLHAVIMAGGAGTRFWPLSRIALPKQLLSFGREHTLLQEAVNRLAPAVSSEHLHHYQSAAGRICSATTTQFRANAIIGEPAKKDTAPCIALAAA